MTDRTARHRGAGPAEHRCARRSGGSNEKYAEEQIVCEAARANDEQHNDVIMTSSSILGIQQDSIRCDNRDIASLLGIIAALSRELESKNEYIESNARKMAALSDALERALGLETLWARSHIVECAVAVGTALFAFCLYRAVLC